MVEGVLIAVWCCEKAAACFLKESMKVVCIAGGVEIADTVSNGG